MKLKNKWKRFWTLERHANHGFTLVELIVVIAILGILAGAGTAGYAGYVKSAKKKADQTLVSNIVRAIEVGTNSTMFVNDDSFKMGKMSYPIGFITLTADATTDSHVVTSSTEVYPATEGNCDFVRVDGIVTVTTVTDHYVCENHKNNERTTVSAPTTIYYCREHGPEAVITELTGTYTSDYNHTAGTYKIFGYTLTGCTGSNTCGTFTAVDTPYAEGAKTISNLDALYQPSADNSSLCEAAYANQYKTFGTPEVGNATVGDTLYDAITAAFGSVEGLKLQYDGWKSDEGIGYATANSYLSDAFGELTTMAELLASDGLLGAGVNLYFGDTWESQEEAITEAATSINGQYGDNESAFLTAWGATADVQYDQAGFGVNTGNSTTDKVAYNTLRMMYNQAFASFLVAKGVPNEYVTVVKTFDNGITWQGDGGKTYYIPAVVNKNAFALDAEGNNASGLLQDFKTAGDTTAGQDGSWFNKCSAYYEEYLESPAYDENAKTVLNMVSTVATNSDIAGDSNNAYGGDYVKYFSSYIDEMDALYTAAETAAGDGIIIIVTVENGEVKCNVSPSAADLRNAD